MLKVKSKLYKLFGQKYRINSQYYDNDVSNLKYCNINLDLRQPEEGKKYVRIGKDCSISGNIIFETSEGFVDIGNRVYVGNATFICKNQIVIEDDVHLAWDIIIYDHNAHSFDYKERIKDTDVFLENKKNNRTVLFNKNWGVVKSSPIRICRYSWIGMNSIILNGVTIGEGAIIGAGSVVRTDIPPWTIATGNPAVIISKNRFKPDS